LGVYRKGLADKILSKKRQEKEDKRSKRRRRYNTFVGHQVFGVSNCTLVKNYFSDLLAYRPVLDLTLRLIQVQIQTAIHQAVQIVLQVRRDRVDPVHQIPVPIVVHGLVARTLVHQEASLIHPHLDHHQGKDAVKILLP
jgi:hypothetical protein